MDRSGAVRHRYPEFQGETGRLYPGRVAAIYSSIISGRGLLRMGRLHQAWPPPPFESLWVPARIAEPGITRPLFRDFHEPACRPIPRCTQRTQAGVLCAGPDLDPETLCRRAAVASGRTLRRCGSALPAAWSRPTPTISAAGISPGSCVLPRTSLMRRRMPSSRPAFTPLPQSPGRPHPAWHRPRPPAPADRCHRHLPRAIELCPNMPRPIITWGWP